MTKSEYENKINTLFNEWKKARPEYEVEGVKFTEDGISSFEDWEKSNPKILFLLKENLAQDWDPIEGITKTRSNKFSINIVRWFFVIKELFENINKQIDLDEVDGRLPDILDSIAIVEVKKINEGKGITPYPVMIKYAENDAEFLIKEINLINPQIVVCGFTIDAYNTIYSEDKEVISPVIKTCRCYKHNQRLVIDFYHPSTRSHSRDYELLDVLCAIIKEGQVFEKFDWGKK